MKLAYLGRTRVERHGTRAYTASVWHLLDEHQRPILDWTFQRQGQAQRIAANLNLFIMPAGMRRDHLIMLWDFRDHYGTRWRPFMNRIWHGVLEPPWHMQDRKHLMLELKTSQGYIWLTKFKLPERFDIHE